MSYVAARALPLIHWLLVLSRTNNSTQILNSILLIDSLLCETIHNEGATWTMMLLRVEEKAYQKMNGSCLFVCSYFPLLLLLCYSILFIIVVTWTTTRLKLCTSSNPFVLRCSFVIDNEEQCVYLTLGFCQVVGYT